MSNSEKSMEIALAWCLAWGDKPQPQFGLNVLQEMRQALKNGAEVPEDVKVLVEQVQQLETIKFPQTLDQLKQLTQQYPTLWSSKIGLVYGGATKIKQYVFEAAKLPDIRGASALLDRINLIDLPAFFGKYPDDLRYREQCEKARDWLDNCSAKDTDNIKITNALIPELIIYSTGGNILAFCPSAYVNDLANAIEKRYTEETLTANSCAVGDSFRLLETRFGLLQNPIENTLWLDWYQSNHENPIIQAYYKDKDEKDLRKQFENRKSFNELAGKLASQFNVRRSGNDSVESNRPSRRYPPIFETHPYLKRDEGDRRSAILRVTELPGEPWFSETLARKRLMGQISNRQNNEQQWYYETGLEWQPGRVESWVSEFERFLLVSQNSELRREYYANSGGAIQAKSLTEIGNASNGFVAYIYADGNNMGGYIQKIETPQKYQQFSEDIFKAIKYSVYKALAQHLHPHPLKGLTGTEHQNRNGRVIHPFEILAIGGDDVMLIVPANKALDIAKTIGEEFEKQLLEADKKSYGLEEKLERKCKPELVHRYRYQAKNGSEFTQQCKLSMSTGVIITAIATPIYYAEKLTEQLLKSAKKRAKDLKEKGYYGGTVDFMVMKSVTMISSNIGEFRRQGLTKYGAKEQELKLYAAPYTLHELDGLIKTVKALKKSEFPRSQLYQIRSLLEQGKNTAILNYRYFRVRLNGKEQQTLLKEKFEDAWCGAITNKGNLAPWMTDIGSIIENLMLLLFFETFPSDQFILKYAVLRSLRKLTYETIWRELVDLYPFIEESEETATTQQTTNIGNNA
ncbi:MAG: type III-B CRISPR-associated protein Cas10/Cmr2 [Coleofasciculaceae cyanobacterium]